MFRSTRSLVALLLFATVTLNAQSRKTEDSFKNPYNGDNTPVNAENPEHAGARQASWLERVGGELDADFAQRLSQEIEKKRQLNELTAGSAFTNIGPTNANKFQNGVNDPGTDSGRLRAVLQDPTNSNVVYVAVGVGGVWKTSNFFAEKPTWVPLTDEIGTASGDLVFGRSPNVLYYGTGDPLDWGVGGAMYVSIDGATFGGKQQLAGATDVAAIAVDTSQGTSAANDIVLVGTNVGMFRSTNGGGSYAKVGSIPSNIVWSIVKSDGAWLASVQTAGSTTIFKSTDNGATWSSIGNIAANMGRTTLAAGGPNNRVVYAIAARADINALQRDGFRSSDGGATWTALGLNTKTPVNPNRFNPTMDILTGSGQAWYNQMLVVDPNDGSGNTVYVGGVYASAVSKDGGASWRILSSWLGSIKITTFDQQGSLINDAPINLPYVHADHHCAIIGKGPKGEKVLFWGTDGGIFYSVNDGKNFNSSANEGLVTHMIYTMASSPARPDAVIIGLQDNGTRYRVGQGTTYNGSIGGDGIGTGWSQKNNNMAVGSVYTGSVRRWLNPPPNNQSKYDVRAIPRTTTPDDRPFFTTVVMPPSDPTGYMIYSNSATRLWKTLDGGDNWTSILNLSGAPAPRIRHTVHPIGVSPSDENRVAVIATGGGVLINQGSGFFNSNVIAQVAGYDGFNANVAWSSNNQTLYVTSESPNPGVVRVAKSTNGGTNWVAAGSGLPDVPITKVVVHPLSADGQRAFAATWIGLYETTDGGASWHPYGPGLPNGLVSDIYIFPNGSKIRVSTYGRGVWEANL
jgi:hypothetical protein